MSAGNGSERVSAKIAGRTTPELVPPIEVHCIRPLSEQRVVAALVEQLPPECTVLHGYEILTRAHVPEGGRDGRLVQGEADAIVLWPGLGVLVLEIKGGVVSFDAASRQWTSRSRGGRMHPIGDPFRQARSLSHKVAASVADHVGRPVKELGLTVGYAVVLPASRVIGRPTLEHADPAIVCDGSGLAGMRRFVETALASWDRPVPANVEPVPMARVRQALLPSFDLAPSLLARLHAEKAVFRRLSDEQYNYLRFASGVERARVAGVAGSGKTVLALRQARSYAAAGRRTLLTCYNRSLADALQREVADDENGPDVLTFHQLCERVALAAGVDFDVPEGPDAADAFWNERTAELLATHAAGTDTVYDAIVVDEGQDFRAPWWGALRRCLVPAGRFFVFHDERQDVFGANGLRPLDSLPRFELPTNCRNTQAISRWCGEIASVDPATHDDAPEGRAVVLHIEPDDGARKDLVESVLSDWLVKEGLKANQVVILSPWRKGRTCLAGVESLAGSRLTSDLAEWRASRGVLVTTVRAFKGLEADAVVLLDLPVPGSHPVFGTADLYVGASRARSLLCVIAKDRSAGVVGVAA